MSCRPCNFDVCMKCTSKKPMTFASLQAQMSVAALKQYAVFDADGSGLLTHEEFMDALNKAHAGQGTSVQSEMLEATFAMWAGKFQNITPMRFAKAMVSTAENKEVSGSHGMALIPNLFEICESNGLDMSYLRNFMDNEAVKKVWASCAYQPLTPELVKAFPASSGASPGKQAISGESCEYALALYYREVARVYIKPKMDERMTALFGDCFHPAPIKGWMRIQFKLDEEYKDDTQPHAAQLLDLCRASLYFDTPEQVVHAVQTLEKEFHLLRLKNRMGLVMRDMLCNILVEHEGHKMVCEVQIKLNGVPRNSDAHKYYQLARCNEGTQIVAVTALGSYIMLLFGLS